LDLVQGRDAKDRAEGSKLRDIKREAVAEPPGISWTVG